MLSHANGTLALFGVERAAVRAQTENHRTGPEPVESTERIPGIESMEAHTNKSMSKARPEVARKV